MFHLLFGRRVSLLLSSYCNDFLLFLFILLIILNSVINYLVALASVVFQKLV